MKRNKNSNNAKRRVEISSNRSSSHDKCLALTKSIQSKKEESDQKYMYGICTDDKC